MNQKEKTMTLKEIAELLGYKTEKTLLKWIKNNGEDITKNGEIFTIIKSKLTESLRTKKPAEFTRDESIAIVRLKNQQLANLLLSIVVLEEEQQQASLTMKRSELENYIDSRIDSQVEEKLSGIPEVITLLKKIAQNMKIPNKREKLLENFMLLPSPEPEPPEDLNQVVEEIKAKIQSYKSYSGLIMSKVLDKFYSSLKTQMGVDFLVPALNAGKSVPDYLLDADVEALKKLWEIANGYVNEIRQTIRMNAYVDNQISH